MSNAHKAVFSATKILLPIDFSPCSEAALEAASGLAEQFHAGIHLVHIIPEIQDFNGSDFFPETAVLQECRETIEEKLDARREQLMLKGVAASFSTETGNDIVGCLLRVVNHENADMIVISTHGMSGWHPMIFGSIAEQVIKHVNCTLLLLQSHQQGFPAEKPATEAWENFFLPQDRDGGHTGVTAPERESLSQERLDRVADEMAARGRKTERHYEQAHSLFTK